MHPRRPEARSPRVRRRRASMAVAPLEGASATAGGTGVGVSRNRNGSDTANLFERMQRRSVEQRRAEERVEAREEYIKSRYASCASASVAATCTDTGAAAVPFDKDAVLAELVATNKSNFLKLDQELSEDHRIATRRLHASVFAHASDFLQLFRDVNKASALVEILKARVQGTKAAISAISKFSTYNSCDSSNNLDGNSHTVETPFGVSSLSGSGHKRHNGIGTTMAGYGGKTRTRPSLISTRLVRQWDSSDTLSAQSFVGVAGGGVVVGSSSGSPSSGNNTPVQLLLTTRSVNTPSTRLWRDATLRGTTATADAGGATAMLRHHRQGRLEHTNANSEVLNSTDIILFADVVKEGLLRLIAERRYTEAAELMRGVEAEANAKGCMPLLLALEEVFVDRVTNRLEGVPMPLIYSESMHIPLVQLLLRFGRLRSGSQTFFYLHAGWLDREIDKLQLRIDPQNGALIASDFLVCAMQEVLQRQQNLWCSIADDKPFISTSTSDVNDGGADVSGGEGEKKKRNNNNSNSSNNNNNRVLEKLSQNNNHHDINGRSRSDERRTSQVSAVLQLPPSSAAVLWVHDRIDKLAREVLVARALSYGTGAEGGDPSRFRRAVVMLADAIRTVRRMDEFGCAGCDTHLLRLLTPSLVYLQADFSGCADDRLQSTGKAMVEYLVRDVWRMYATRGALYNPHMCAEVARRNNAGCRELQQIYQGLSQTSYAILLEMLLAPASSRLFTRRSNDGTGGNTTANNNNNTNTNKNNNNNNNNSTSSNNNAIKKGTDSSSERTAAYLLPPEQYTFLRYANGCTRVHSVLLTSVLRFMAAMTGQELLPLERVNHSQQMIGMDIHGSQMECVSFLLSNAVVTESLDVTMQRLFLSFMRTTLRQRQALVTLLQSGEFIDMHRKVFPEDTKLSPLPPSASPTKWVFGAMQLLLADVLGASVWIAFLSRGQALSQMLLDATLAFQVQHVEELRRVLPRLVQGWMAAALSLAYSVDAAQGLLLGDAAFLLFDGDAEREMGTPADATTVGAFATHPNSGNNNTNNRDAPSSSSSANANSASAFKMTSSAVNLVEDTNGAREAAAHLIQAAAVNETHLQPFLLDLIKRRFILYHADKQKSALLCVPLPPPPSPAWCLREVLGDYPQFPIGGDFDSDDELFLFHWCVQMSLNTLAFFQEQLLVPSHVVNQRWAAAHTTTTGTTSTGGSEFPLRGCISPPEESLIGVLETGGGNYAGGVALLQFIVFRLLRDVLCSLETWSMMYNVSAEIWRKSESVLRQQIFFFAVFVRFWSPLFVGGVRTTPCGQPTMSNRNNNTDGAPSLVLLQWLTCTATTGESTKEQQRKEQKQRGVLDVEGLAFSRNVTAASSASAAQRVGSWRNPHGNRNNSNIRTHDNNSGSKQGQQQQQQQQHAENDRRRSSIPMNTSVTENSTSGVHNRSGVSSDDPSRLLLDVIASFFEFIHEPRGMPGITSEVTRNRVERVITAVNLSDFLGKVRLSDDSDDSDDDDDEDDNNNNNNNNTSRVSRNSTSKTDRTTRSSLTSLSSEAPKRQGKLETDYVTFLHVHKLLQYYIAPFL